MDTTTAVLKGTVVGLSPRRSRFSPKAVYVGFLVDSVASGIDFSPNLSIFLCQRDSTNATYSYLIHLQSMVNKLK